MMTILARILVFVTTTLAAWRDRFVLATGARKAAWGCLPILGACMLCSVVGQAVGLVEPSTPTPEVVQAQAPPAVAASPTNTPAPPPTNTAVPTPTASPTGVSTPTAAATSTPRPTATSRPTRTPAPPTPTREPESTPTTAPTTIADDPAAQRYIAAVREQIGTLSDALSEAGTLMQEPQFGDEDWSLQLAVQFITIQYAHEQLSEIENVPPIFQPAHETMLEGTAACDRATRLATRGIDSLDPELLYEAVDEMNLCTTKIQEATLLLPTE